MSARAGMVALLSALVLGIGISQAANGRLVRKTYQVAEIVVPVPGNGSTASNGPTATSEEQLIKLITSTIAPDSWSDMGGVGTIEYFPQTLALVINQTVDVQDQVADLLAALRRLQDQEVATEVRFVAVSEKMFQDLKQCGLLKAENEENVSFLKEARLRQLMERIQQDPATNVMQTPRQTAFNGQTCKLDVADEQRFVTGVDIRSRNGFITAEPKTEVIPMGLRMRLQPIISADRRFVRISLNLKLNSLVSDKVPLFPVTSHIGSSENPELQPVVFTQYIQQPRITKLRLERTLVIPDGHTAVLTAQKRSVEQRNEYGPPVLSNIPYVNRLFKNVGYGRSTECLLVLVTTRIVVPEETEKKEEKAPTSFDSTRVCPSKVK